MGMTIRSKIIKIGNSRGVRIPRTLLDQAGLSGDVQLTVEGENLIIHSTHHPRHDWEAAFKAMAENKDDRSLDALPTTEWDEKEWEW